MGAFAVCYGYARVDAKVQTLGGAFVPRLALRGCRAVRIGESLGVPIYRHGCCTAGSGSLDSSSVAVVPTSFLTRQATGLLVAALVQTDDVVASRCLTSAGRDAPCHLKVHSSQQGTKAPTQSNIGLLSVIAMGGTFGSLLGVASSWLEPEDRFKWFCACCIAGGSAGGVSWLIEPSASLDVVVGAGVLLGAIFYLAG